MENTSKTQNKASLFLSIVQKDRETLNFAIYYFLIVNTMYIILTLDYNIKSISTLKYV